MKRCFISGDNLQGFIGAMMKKWPVIAPVANRTRFVFAELVEAGEARLDYDTTILPPKKVFFPTKQALIEFDGKVAKSCISPREQVLFGVHPYDIKAIAMSDQFYSDSYVDENYMANRRATTIIGTNVQKHYKHAFFGSVCRELPVTGHDMFLTKVSGGYVADILTARGEKLLKLGKFVDATAAQTTEADKVNKQADENCPEKHRYTTDQIRKKVRASFESEELWKELSEDCFSCGSCNTVCPTCYCFDVQDEWGLDGKSARRCRTWDSCLVEEFSEVTGQGGCENFREDRAERFRHRFMRKTSYLNDQFGGPACVGCGRCSGACTAEIADPVMVINKIMEQ